MPIYEYECSTCGHRFEKMVRIGAEPPPCPACADLKVVKRISASGFILKGSGWYKDHYGLKGGEKGASEKGDKAEKGADKPAASGDAAAPAASAPKTESSGTGSAAAPSTTTTTVAK